MTPIDFDSTDFEALRQEEYCEGYCGSERMGGDITDVALVKMLAGEDDEGREEGSSGKRQVTAVKDRKKVQASSRAAECFMKAIYQV